MSNWPEGYNRKNKKNRLFWQELARKAIQSAQTPKTRTQRPTIDELPKTNPNH
jgi:hypothetical protein